MKRRDVLLMMTALTTTGSGAAFAQASQPAAPPAPAPFDPSTVPALARALAAKSFQAPDTTLPDTLKNLTYSQYREIRFDPNHALWRGDGRFEVEFFHRGFLYKDRVDVFQVAGGQATPVRYTPSLFIFDKVAPPASTDVGFAGLRLHAPINRPDYFDEVCAFLGASYFRAVGRNQVYGLSARGLSIKTADPAGEEFPVFKSFWIEQPGSDAANIVVWALLDSESVAASFRFDITPGPDTVFDVSVTMFPRVDIAAAGVAPLTSMFYFGPSRAGIDDWRPQVHDSSGLLMVNGAGGQFWRQLANPAQLQFSAFSDTSPRGFGLMQRDRDFADYEDLEASYQNRPSLWVEPVGSWGEGSVDLVEIPTKDEINDNIVAFWRPKQPLAAKTEIGYRYRLHWCRNAPVPQRARFVQTRIGAGRDAGTRLFVLDVGPIAEVPAEAALVGHVTADHGKLANIVTRHDPQTGGWRISFELVPGDARMIELTARLDGADAPLSETWMYRWTG